MNPKERRGTVLSRVERAKTGAPTAEEKAHDEVAKRHFLAYCDHGKCTRERAGYQRGGSWHEGVCLGCCFNPYNMAAQAGTEVSP